MAGRHSTRRGAAGSSRGAGFGLRAVLAVCAAIVLVVGAIVVLSGGSTKKHKAPPGRSAAAESCTGIRVVADPGIAPAVTKFAAAWQAGHPKAAGACVTATVTSQAGPAAVASLAKITTPVVWIPDSSVWSTELTAAVPALAPLTRVGGSVASTPLVLATAPGHATAIGQQASVGWTGMMLGATPVSIADPSTDATATLTVTALRSTLGGAAHASPALVGAYVKLSTVAVTSTAAGLAKIKSSPATEQAFVASEQAVDNANAGSSTPFVSAVHPAGAAEWLTFPFVAIDTVGASAAVLAAEALFQQALATPAALSAFAAVHLRNPAGVPIVDDLATPTIADHPTTATSVPSAADLGGALQLYEAAAKPSRLLSVWDVSGSMADNAGNGKSKIALASAAAQSALAIIPDTWTVGVWAFSSHTPPKKDWEELVPLGSVAKYRAPLVAAAKKLPSLVGGNTGLYNTVLAAYKTVLANWDPKRANDVAILTDGANLDPNGITLPTLLADLKSLHNAAKPVRVITLALGSKADVSALKKISAVTGGSCYIVAKPTDIDTAIIGAILQRS